MSNPFFSIGVTTFRRRELLRQTLTSILEQSFTDFEVIVGNDDVSEALHPEELGITDPRVRIINHPSNLREVGNMNALLAFARGRYFTWLADDDLLARDHLRLVHEQLTAHRDPDALFTSYEFFRGNEPPPPALSETAHHTAESLLMTGPEFLDRYFAGKLKIISVYGLFAIDRLRAVIGGMEELCEGGVALYAEYLFLVRCGLLDRIVVLEAPLVLSRAHDQSWGSTNLELEKYVRAGRELVRRCAMVMQHPSLTAKREKRLRSLCSMHLAWLSWRAATVEIASDGSLWRAVRRHGEEVREIRGIFEEATGAPGAWTFVLDRLRGVYFIAGMTFMSRWRRARSRIARGGTT